MERPRISGIMKREFRELSDRRPGLRPPQFSLFALMILVTTIAGILVLGVRSGPLAALAAAVAGLSIFAHMASTAIGGRLRANGQSAVSESKNDEDPGEETRRIRQPIRAKRSDFARTTQLSHKTALERRPILIAVALGAGIFAILGGTLLSVLMWNDFSIVNVLFGAFSSAVLGGLLGFWLSSFFQVVRNAIAEAQEEG
jgi:hypothetical protein